MSINSDLTWIFPNGEVKRRHYNGETISWHHMCGTAPGTILLSQDGDWMEHRGDTVVMGGKDILPAHIKAKCLLLGIQP